MAELIDVFNALRGKNWNKISEDDKVKNFFIINRYMSKKYPEKAQLLNSKLIDKATALDLWHHFMKTEPYPNWFWSKGQKVEKAELNSKDFDLLFSKMDLNKKEDLIYLYENFPDIIEQELKFYKNKK